MAWKSESRLENAYLVVLQVIDDEVDVGLVRESAIA